MLKNIVINNFKITFCIYAIRCNKTQQVYIGATSNIQSRISNHISSYKSGNSKCSSRTIFEHDDYTIDILLNDLTKEGAIQSENDFIVAYGKMAVNQNKPISVSYTHLRAHETHEQPVCRQMHETTKTYSQTL